MKLIETFVSSLTTIAAQVKNTFSGWKIETNVGYKKFYEIFLTPSVRFNDWSATRMREGPDGEYINVSYRQHYALTAAFLTAHASVALTKETLI